MITQNLSIRILIKIFILKKFTSHDSATQINVMIRNKNYKIISDYVYFSKDTCLYLQQFVFEIL